MRHVIALLVLVGFVLWDTQQNGARYVSPVGHAFYRLASGY